MESSVRMALGAITFQAAMQQTAHQVLSLLHLNIHYERKELSLSHKKLLYLGHKLHKLDFFVIFPVTLHLPLK